MEVIEYLMEQRLQKTLLASLEAPSVQDALKSVITVTSEEKRLIRHLLSSQRRGRDEPAAEAVFPCLF